MRANAFGRIVLLGGFLISAFNYCPPGAQAAATRVPDCCRKKAAKSHCPDKAKDQTNTRSCCTAERLAFTDASKFVLAPVAVPLYALPVEFVAPRPGAHRLDAPVRSAGPPGLSHVSHGSRAPPSA